MSLLTFLRLNIQYPNKDQVSPQSNPQITVQSSRADPQNDYQKLAQFFKLKSLI